MLRKKQRYIYFLIVLSTAGLMSLMYATQNGALSKTKLYLSKIKSLEGFRQTEQSDQFANKDRTINSLHDHQEPDKSKTKVYRYSGKELQRLHDFCTWSLPMDCTTLQTPGGPMTIFIHDVEDDPSLSGVLKETGVRDADNVAIVINELRKYPDAGFLDLGSHIGTYSLSVARTLGRNVMAVDPMIENTVRLCKSTQLNKLTDKLTIIYNAVSDEKTKINFKKPHQHIGGTKVVKSSSSGETPCDDSEHFSVVLDDLIPVVSFKTAVMKLDVETSEYLVIRGGQKFLQEIDVKSILMEWYNIVSTPQAEPLVELMKGLRYVPFIPHADGNHRRVQHEDYKLWQKYRSLLDVLWIKET